MFMENFKIVRFVDNSFEIDVRADINNETVWLSQDEMASLFNVDRTRIVRHINNIYKDKELDINSTCAENAHVQIEGNRKVNRTIKIYNLDMIISVGYRVKSQRGIIFRKWANKILKEYLIQGYSINKKRIEVLNKTIEVQNACRWGVIPLSGELSYSGLARWSQRSRCSSCRRMWCGSVC